MPEHPFSEMAKQLARKFLNHGSGNGSGACHVSSDSHGEEFNDLSF